MLANTKPKGGCKPNRLALKHAKGCIDAKQINISSYLSTDPYTLLNKNNFLIEYCYTIQIGISRFFVS